MAKKSGPLNYWMKYKNGMILVLKPRIGGANTPGMRVGSVREGRQTKRWEKKLKTWNDKKPPSQKKEKEEKTIQVNGMTWSAGKRTEACPIDPNWNSKVSFPFLKERILPFRKGNKILRFQWEEVGEKEDKTNESKIWVAGEDVSFCLPGVVTPAPSCLRLPILQMDLV